jgi:MoxR-like ATPase
VEHPQDAAHAEHAQYPGTVAELTSRLRDGGYLADRGLATTLLVSLSLRRPVLLEGEVGVGKTEVAKVLAAVFGRKLIRLQCYEGISTSQALYEWDYARQMLQIRALSQAEATDERSVDQLFGPKFLLERPLLEAVRQGDRAVLLIDEVDRADDEFEAFLLEMLSDFQISIPEIGTIRADSSPVVILTSNRTRELHDALRRRCLYHWIGYPTSASRPPRSSWSGRSSTPCSGCASSTWPSRPGSRRRSTGSARSACSARPS